jgi:hypothetical protein
VAPKHRISNGEQRRRHAGTSRAARRINDPSAKRPRHSKKDYDDLVEAARNAAWWCETKRSNYIACYPPDDREVVSVASTPSGSHTLRNLRARFRRSGLEI